jgi:hypothetical protein
VTVDNGIGNTNDLQAAAAWEAYMVAPDASLGASVRIWNLQGFPSLTIPLVALAPQPSQKYMHAVVKGRFGGHATMPSWIGQNETAAERGGQKGMSSNAKKSCGGDTLATNANTMVQDRDTHYQRQARAKPEPSQQSPKFCYFAWLFFCIPIPC